MLEINGYTANAVIYNGHPTTGIYNGSVVWGAQPWNRYTASGKLTSWGGDFGIDDQYSTSCNFYYRVSSISQDIPGTWLNYYSCLNPPVGTYFGPGSHLYVKANFSAYSNRNNLKISGNNLHNVNTANRDSYYVYNAGPTANLNSGTYTGGLATANISLNEKYANGSTYSSNSGFYTTWSIGPKANFTTATCNITGSMWSAEFYIQG